MLVEDNGPIHTSKRSLAALAARAHWLTVEWLPKYAPELNDIDPVWHDLKAYHLAHQTFTDAAALEQAIHDAVTKLNRERMLDPLAKSRNLCHENSLWRSPVAKLGQTGTRRHRGPATPRVGRIHIGDVVEESDGDLMGDPEGRSPPEARPAAQSPGTVPRR